MFRSSVPATDAAFHDRSVELARLGDAVEKLVAGTPSWLAIVGPRKVGKTSLLLEAARRESDRSLRLIVVDVLDTLPPSVEVFRLLAIRALDVTLGAELAASLEHLSTDPPAFRAALQRSPSFARLSPADRAATLELPGKKLDEATLRFVLELPERLAHALGIHLVLAIDEFQELASTSGNDPIPLLRSVWQRHRRVAYVISGSARTTLTELVTSERSPFFQHFALMELGPFSENDAVELLTTESPAARPISRELAERAVATIGGHPFHLQLLGEAIVAREPPYDLGTLRDAIEELVFSRTGRLSLYFENEHQRLVGRAAMLAATLDALAEGPRRLTEVATATGQGSGAAVRSIERLGDAIVRGDDGRYSLADPVFALWLRWRRPGGGVVPMKLLGDEAEAAVADALARMGFDLVYQSRASRGAFDLFAVRGATQLGVQVKRSPLPLRFTKTEWSRMVADADRFGWQFIVVAADGSGSVRALDPERARKAREVRLDEGAVIENLLAWVDRRVARRRRRS